MHEALSRFVLVNIGPGLTQDSPGYSTFSGQNTNLMRRFRPVFFGGEEHTKEIIHPPRMLRS